MTRTNINLQTPELEESVKSKLFKTTLFFPIPTWLDETLQAHSFNESILSNSETVNSILTADDIKFYNQNCGHFICLMEHIGLPNDINISKLHSKVNDYSFMRHTPEGLSYEENSISRKDMLIPFIKGGHDFDGQIIWSLVASYSIHKLADVNVVGIRLKHTESKDTLQLQLEENEKLAEFALSEYGLTEVAGTHLFKKILESKRSYY